MLVSSLSLKQSRRPFDCSRRHSCKDSEGSGRGKSVCGFGFRVSIYGFGFPFMDSGFGLPFVDLVFGFARSSDCSSRITASSPGVIPRRVSSSGFGEMEIGPRARNLSTCQEYPPRYPGKNGTLSREDSLWPYRGTSLMKDRILP